MAMYYCDECGELKDDDHSPCMESPKNGELVCEGCHGENFSCQSCDAIAELKYGLCPKCHANEYGEWKRQQRKDDRAEEQTNE